MAEDELSVFAHAARRLFAIADEELMEYRERSSGFIRFIPTRDSVACAPIADALQLLRRLHTPATTCRCDDDLAGCLKRRAFT